MSFTLSRAALAPAKLNFGFYRENNQLSAAGRLQEEESCHPNPISCSGALVLTVPDSIIQGLIIFETVKPHKAKFPHLSKALPTFTMFLQIFMVKVSIIASVI